MNKTKEEILHKVILENTDLVSENGAVHTDLILKAMEAYASQSKGEQKGGVWVKSSSKKPTITGTYFGKYNDNEMCFIYVAGGKVYRMLFTNRSEFSEGFRDMDKVEYQWYDESRNLKQN